MNRHLVTENSSTLTASVGDEILIQVPERATAGYEWRVAGSLPSGLEFFSAPPPPPREDAIGADVSRAIGLRVTGPGRYRVRLLHHRPWEGPERAIGTFEVEVIAEPTGD